MAMNLNFTAIPQTRMGCGWRGENTYAIMVSPLEISQKMDITGNGTHLGQGVDTTPLLARECWIPLLIETSVS
jgi:hypothetical protein